MRILALVTLIVVALILLGLAYYLIVGNILFNILFARKSLSTRVLRKDIHKALEDYKIDLCWWQKIKFKKVTTQSFDQLKLVGHFYNSNSDKTVIVVHGFGQDYREMQPYCKYFYEKKFNVLAIDNRGHGESEGKVGFGWLDRKDLISWIEYLNKILPDQKIVLFGLSMGATAVCAASGENLPSNVRAIISDCAFSSADRQIKHIMRKHKFVLKFFKWHLYDFSKRIRGFDIMKVDASKMVEKSNLPFLFIHGDQDNFVPLENVYLLSKLAQNKEIFVVKDAKHAMAFSVSGIEYEKKISDFIKSRTNI